MVMIGLGAINLPLIYRGTPSLFFSNTVAPHERRQGSQKFGKPLGSSFAYTKIGDSVQWNSDQMWLIFTHVKIQISRCMPPFQKHPYGESWHFIILYATSYRAWSIFKCTWLSYPQSIGGRNRVQQTLQFLKRSSQICQDHTTNLFNGVFWEPPEEERGDILIVPGWLCLGPLGIGKDSMNISRTIE